MNINSNTMKLNPWNLYKKISEVAFVNFWPGSQTVVFHFWFFNLFHSTLNLKSENMNENSNEALTKNLNSKYEHEVIFL